ELPLSLIAPPEHITELLHTPGVADRVSLVGEGEGPRVEVDFLERLELDFPMRDEAPRLARSAVREALGSVVDDEVLPAVVLMTSELMTNAVRHPSRRDPPVVGLRLVVLPDAVRVEVDDPGEGFDPAEQIIPEGLIPDPGAGGRGLFVVDRCASRWGSRRADTDRGRRFSVWFEVETG
ncbi:MAG: ATP-binding protein, partial [Solirubrobacteraceae bacterium]